jgi:hypothetical protein
MRIFSDEVIEKIKTKILCSIMLFMKYRLQDSIMLKNVLQPERPQMEI